MNKNVVLTSLVEIQQWQDKEYTALLILKTPGLRIQMATMHNLKLNDHMENQSQPKFLGCNLNLPSLVFKWKWRKVFF